MKAAAVELELTPSGAENTAAAAARPDVEAAERLMGGAEQQAHADGELEEMPDIGPYVVSCLRGRGRAGENPIDSPWQVLPDWIHEGRWSPLAYVSLLGLAVVLGVSASQARYSPSSQSHRGTFSTCMANWFSSGRSRSLRKSTE